MVKESTKCKYAAIRAEYERLVKIEFEKDPIKAKYLAKGYFVELIANNPDFDIKEPSQIRKIINQYYERKRGK